MYITQLFDCLLITYPLSLCPKQLFAPLINNVLKNSNITLSIGASHPIKNKRNKPCFRSPIFFYINIILVLHPLYMFVIVPFRLCQHETFRIQNFNTFFHKCSYLQDCTSSLRYRFFFTLLHLHQPSLCFYHCLHLYGLLYFQLHFVNSYYYCTTMFSSLVSFCTICASTK